MCLLFHPCLVSHVLTRALQMLHWLTCRSLQAFCTCKHNNNMCLMCDRLAVIYVCFNQFLLGNTKTPSDDPTPAPQGRTGAPPRATPRKSHLAGTTRRSESQYHTISLPSILHHLIGRFCRHRVFSTKHLRRPSMAKYVLWAVTYDPLSLCRRDRKSVV